MAAERDATLWFTATARLPDSSRHEILALVESLIEVANAGVSIRVALGERPQERAPAAAARGAEAV